MWDTDLFSGKFVFDFFCMQNLLERDSDLVGWRMLLMAQEPPYYAYTKTHVGASMK